MACFKIFECIENITLKKDFNNCEIIISTQILIEYQITITECRALIASHICALVAVWADGLNKKDPNLSKNSKFGAKIKIPNKDEISTDMNKSEGS